MPPARPREDSILGRLTIGAMLLGEWIEGATVVFLFGLAQLLETRSMERARGAIRALMDLTPVEAVVRRDGAEVRAGGPELVNRRAAAVVDDESKALLQEIARHGAPHDAETDKANCLCHSRRS